MATLEGNHDVITNNYEVLVDDQNEEQSKTFESQVFLPVIRVASPSQFYYQILGLKNATSGKFIDGAIDEFISIYIGIN